MADLNIWFPLYIGDFLADTARFSTEEIGALLLLQLDYFRNGPPPSDERILRQITRLHGDAWSNAWKTLKPFLVRGDDGKFHNERWDAESAQITQKRANAQNKAANAAKARWENEAPSIAPSIAGVLPAPCQSQSYSQSEAESTTTNSPTAGDSPVLISLPLKDGTEHPVTEFAISEMALSYPSIDLRKEYLKMNDWLTKNPIKRATRRGIRRFITNWLDRSQNEDKMTGGSYGNQYGKTGGNTTAVEEALARRQRRRNSSVVGTSGAC
ncbi:MAG: DUF1376 domain-containing protein [Acidobacteriaceae bacterium]